jgi:hypothetical protein
MDKSFRAVGNFGSAMSMASVLRAELPEVFRRTHAPCKVLAFKAHVSKRTIQGINRGEHAISAAALLDLARVYPPVRSLVMRLIGAEPGEDAKLVSEIANMIARAGK